MTQSDTGSVLPSTEVLLAEYSAANDVYLQYDGFRWQSGSFLIAGVFVYWGFLMQSQPRTAAVTASSLLIAALMACWLLFAAHYRQLYLQKLHRMHEIERALGMEQHLRFVGPNPQYWAYPPRGHTLDAAVFALTAMGGPALATAANGFSLGYLLPLPLVLATLAVVWLGESRLKARLWNTSDGARLG